MKKGRKTDQEILKTHLLKAVKIVAGLKKKYPEEVVDCHRSDEMIVNILFNVAFPPRFNPLTGKTETFDYIREWENIVGGTYDERG